MHACLAQPPSHSYTTQCLQQKMLAACGVLVRLGTRAAAWLRPLLHARTAPHSGALGAGWRAHVLALALLRDNCRYLVPAGRAAHSSAFHDLLACSSPITLPSCLAIAVLGKMPSVFWPLWKPCSRENWRPMLSL